MSSAPLTTVLIKRLRDACPSLQRRVGGTAMFNAIANEEGDVDLPHAFIVPLSEVAAPRSNMGSAQKVREAFGVILCLDNKVDRQDGVGRVAGDELRAIRQELFNALLEWAPLPAVEGLSYVGGRHLTMNRARLWHQYDFAFTEQVAGLGLEPPGNPVPGAADDCVPVTHVEGREHLGGSVEVVDLDQKINDFLGLD